MAIAFTRKKKIINHIPVIHCASGYKQSSLAQGRAQCGTIMLNCCVTVEQHLEKLQ